jgi:Sorting nexin C terminal
MQQLLERDLKFGVNHIDRNQLRRNSLLSPRFPTELLELSAVVEDVQETDVKGVDLFGVSSSVFKIKCSATVALVASDEELNGYISYRTEDGSFAETYKEEWFVYRSLKDFQALHKHLKLQVSAAESSGTAGSRLVGAATAAFAATTASLGRTRQRKMLIPSLSQASKAGALGVTKKLILKRKEILDGYMGYLLSPGHLLGRCSELLMFLGASLPLDPAVHVGETIHSTTDPLGRTGMTRSVLQLRALSVPAIPKQSRSPRAFSTSSSVSVDSQDDDMLDDDDEGDHYRKSGRQMNMIPAVKDKIDKVTLPQVRNRIFELLRYQFGFENASFARNRMLAALKTASFAVTSAAEFRKTLYKLHTEHVNSESIAGWVNFLSDTLWPDGIFFESKPALSPEELQEQAAKAKELLHESFPDQVRAILGQELTTDGMDIFHEMLQNRMVVKSMAYMLFDLLWVAVFPEIGDVLPCGAALDIDG